MISRRRLIAAAFGLALLGGDALAVEEPAFRTIVRDGVFEVRDYPALVVAEVSVSGGQKAAVSAGFRLLAGYIFGGNRRKESISMTAPVTQAPAEGTSALPAPFVQIREARQWRVRFVMPKGSSLQTLPQPDNPAIQLREAPAERVAVVRFSGLAQPAEVTRRTQDLSAWLQARALRSRGAPTLAQYDPPWTLWFMRRNEVMIPIDP